MILSQDEAERAAHLLHDKTLKDARWEDRPETVKESLREIARRLASTLGDPPRDRATALMVFMAWMGDEAEMVKIDEVKRGAVHR